MKITSFETADVRFPTSTTLAGSDATNPDPDYSAAYVSIHTDEGISGHGYTFTIGRGNDLCVAAIELLAMSAPFHDIGNLTIPDGILLQPGRLDAEAFKVVKTHCLHGWEMLRRAAKRMGGDSTCLNFALEIVRHHHERWDGTGYPDGLAGHAIPFSARLMAVADVYDALINQRPYKDSLPHDEAMRRLVAGAGSQFDPAVVDAMLACEQRFIDIARTWRN